MLYKLLIAALFLLLLGTSDSAFAGNHHGEKSWLHSFHKAYRDPANYSGRSNYPGSRFGFSGYVRPVPNTDPIPRSMRKTVPPTMYHWSKSAKAGEAQGHYVEPHALPESGSYEYWAE